MKILDILNSPWAIIPEKLQEIQNIYVTHLRGEKIDIKGLEAKLGRPLQNEPQGYDLINGNAIIPIQGVIAKKMNLMTQISRGASTEFIARDLKTALQDPAVDKIILYIDSPGGTIDGTAELANLIYESRGIKPIIAYTDGQLASAAYWIGSAAEKIYISGDTTTIGSIGVVTAHIDVSKFEEKLGIKTTEIYAGKYKRIASQYAPLTDIGRATIQEEVDYFYSVFVGDVAKFKNISIEQALQMSDGKLFIGHQAIKIGLVDGVSTLDLLKNNTIGVMAEGSHRAGSKKLKAEDAQRPEEEIMTKEELKDKQPEIYQAVLDEGQALGLDSMEDAVESAKIEGAKAELARIKSVKEQLMAGHETLIETLMFDGVTTEEQAAMKILAAEKAMRQAKLEAFQKENIPKIPVVDSGDAVASTIKRKDFEALSQNQRAAFIKGGGKLID